MRKEREGEWGYVQKGGGSGKTEKKKGAMVNG